MNKKKLCLFRSIEELSLVIDMHSYSSLMYDNFNVVKFIIVIVVVFIMLTNIVDIKKYPFIFPDS